MSTTHDYETLDVPGQRLDESMTLVGESGGLSSVYIAAAPLSNDPYWTVTTEHGMLIFRPDRTFQILLDGVPRCDTCFAHHETVEWCGETGMCAKHCTNHEEHA